MQDPEDLTFSYNRMELCSYRYLQQLAKSFGLPSNVKKVYLIEMIYAKKYCTAEEVEIIVDRIKEERKRIAQAKPKKKKKRVQGTEISSTCNRSPPIHYTPRRSSGGVVTYPPHVRQTVMKYRQESNILHPTILKRSTESDRVLRSFNNRMRPNYSVLNISDSFMEVIKAEKARIQDQKRQCQLRMSVHEQRHVTESASDMRPIGYGECSAPSQRKGFGDLDGSSTQMALVSRTLNTSPQKNRPENRQRRVSGIYPLQPPDTSYIMRTLDIRCKDGRICKVNAVVRKPLVPKLKPPERNTTESTERRMVKTVQRNMLKQLNYTERSTTSMGRNSMGEEGTSAIPLYTTRNLQKTQPEVTVYDLIPRPMVTSYDVDYKLNRYSFSNSSTESATETSGERENIPNENYQRNTVDKSCDTLSLKKYTQRANFTQNTLKTITEKSNAVNPKKSYNMAFANYVTEKTNNNAKIYMKRGHRLAAKPTYTESTNFAVEKTNYPTENQKKNTGSSANYSTTKPTYTESANYYTENQNVFTESYPAPNAYYVIEEVNRNTLPDTQKVQARNAIDYPNMSALTDIEPGCQVTELNSNQNGTLYYHKKIRAEHMRSQRPMPRHSFSEEDNLPRINEVFSQFQGVDSRRPAPILQTAGEPNDGASANTHTLLETIYNFKRQFMTNEPLAMPYRVGNSHTTIVDTQCVYSTPIITSAVAIPPPAPAPRIESFTHSYQKRDSQQYNVETETVPRLYDYIKMAEQERTDFTCHEVMSPSNSSSGTTSCQDVEGNTTIPEMVEDALELISQDGDYMERIGMDVRMQCILCEWAGPKILLERHIRKDHPSDIVEMSTDEWRLVFPIGGGEGGAGVGRGPGRECRAVVVRHARHLYVVSVNCAELTSCWAMLTVLPTGSEVPIFARITVYNKVTGEPHTWEGEVECIPDTMPYHADCNGLKLDLTKLDLLPNSANLKLVNGELVVNSAPKVVVGRTELSNIEIVVYVKIFD